MARRELTIDEMRKLLAVTVKADDRQGLTGGERALLYRFAFETGLRPGQIRKLTVADNLRVHPTTIMPSYYKVDGLARVASAYQDKPILSAGEVEDVVAYLATLR